MTELELLIRGGALGIMVLMVVILAGQAARAGTGMARRKWLAVCVTAVLAGCYLLISSPAISALISGPGPWAGIGSALRLVLIAGAMLAPVGVSWLVMEIFFDQPADQGLVAECVLGLAAVTVAASMMTLIMADGPVTRVVEMIRGGLAILLYLTLIWLAVRSGPDDLVPARRRFRRVFVGLMALTGIAITALEIAARPADLPSGIFVLQALVFLLLAVAFSLWLLRSETPLWPQMPAPIPTPGVPDMPVQDTAAPPDTREYQLITRIRTAMGAEIWRREGLTIAALAHELAVPEHRLRATINGQMGYRNFSALINGYRIDAARAALADPARTDITVLEIAYECGFASLGPFNRAFRAQTGQSPTEYRRDAAGRGD